MSRSAVARARLRGPTALRWYAPPGSVSAPSTLLYADAFMRTSGRKAATASRTALRSVISSLVVHERCYFVHRQLFLKRSAKLAAGPCHKHPDQCGTSKVGSSGRAFSIVRPARSFAEISGDCDGHAIPSSGSFQIIVNSSSGA